MSIEVNEVNAESDAGQMEVLLGLLQRLQVAHFFYAYCDNNEAGKASDDVDAIERELGELLIPRGDKLPFNLAIIRRAHILLENA